MDNQTRHDVSFQHFDNDNNSDIKLPQSASATSKHTECTVRGALAISLRVSRVFGCAPLLFYKEDDSWRIQFSKRLCIVSYIIHGFLSYFTLRRIIDEWLRNWERVRDIRLIIVDLILRAGVGLATVVVSTVAMFKLRACMETMIHNMHRLEKINPQGLSRRPQERRNIIILILIYLEYFFITFCTFFDTSYSKSPTAKYSSIAKDTVSRVLIFMDGFRVILIQSQLMFTIMTINSKMQGLNDILEKNKNDFKSQKFQSDATPAPENIRRLCLSFVTICDAQQEVSRVNSVLLLVIIFKPFLHLIESPHRLISMTIGEHKSTTSTYSFITQVMWCFFHFFSLLMLIEPCHHITDQVEKTQELVLHLMRHTNSFKDALGIELEQFYKQIDMNRPCYSAMGMCNVTRALITAIVGTIITYLVVILQIQ